jgi:two-component system phosphate regulon response regulator OmpR
MMPAEEKPHVLVVDDDKRLRELLRKYLVEQGFLVTAASDAGEARERLASFAFDLLIVDVMMPGESGLELTSDLRRSSRMPILLLTAKGEPEDRISGLERGADDYLAKPFEPRELVLRMRTILRRVAPEAPVLPSTEIRLGPLTFDIERRTLRRGNDEIRLTTAESDLLTLLARNPNVALSRDELGQQADDAGNSRTVDVQMTRLRRKIESDPRFPRYLQTVRGRGYVLRPD